MMGRQKNIKFFLYVYTYAWCFWTECRDQTVSSTSRICTLFLETVDHI